MASPKCRCGWQLPEAVQLKISTDKPFDPSGLVGVDVKCPRCERVWPMPLPRWISGVRDALRNQAQAAPPEKSEHPVCVCTHLQTFHAGLTGACSYIVDGKDCYCPAYFPGGVLE